MPTSRLRLQKISALLTPSLSMTLRSAARLVLWVPSPLTTISSWTTFSAGVDGGAVTISFGLFRNASASRRIAGGIVAENSSVCRLRETKETMRSTSGMNPMSSIRSASSMTRILTSLSSRWPRSKTSISRPGVAISTSAPRSRTRIWSFIDSPPISSALDSLWYLP